MIKLISLNIELDKHLNLVREFLQKEKADVVCLQEVHQTDLLEIAQELGMQATFAPMSLIGRGEYTKPPFSLYGVGMLSTLPMENIQQMYYRGSEEESKKHIFTGTSRDGSHVLLLADVKKDNVVFSIGTTHFTWTPNGKADDLQRSDLSNLLAALKKIPQFVLCGDFNAPRGKETFDIIAHQYKDNIPVQYTTSLDLALHDEADKLQNKSLMVDGLFTTSDYQSSDVRLQDGVSDHMAIVAHITHL